MSQNENVLDINKLIEVTQSLVHDDRIEGARMAMNTVQPLQYGDRKMLLTVIVHDEYDKINVAKWV